METEPAPTALIGDIHGCSEELRELLALIGSRHVVSLGDVVDRGPDPDGCIALLREADAAVVLGNHEDKHFRYRRHEEKARTQPSHRNPMHLAPHHHDTQRLVSSENWRWLESRCVPFLRLSAHRVLAVHAGLQAGIPAEKHKPERICRVQMTRPGLGDKSSPWGGFSRSAGGAPELAEPAVRAVSEGYRWWTEFLEGDEIVVYGHSVFPVPFASHREASEEPGLATTRHSFVDGREIPREGLTSLGIDTGAPFGGALTALLLPEWTILRVEAKARYYGGAMDEG